MTDQERLAEILNQMYEYYEEEELNDNLADPPPSTNQPLDYPENGC